MKKKPLDILIALVVAYLFLGFGIVTVQTLSGAKCGPIKLGGDYVYTVNVDAPRFWIMRALQWAPVAWGNVVDGDVSVADHLIPKECLFVPDNKTPQEVAEEEAKKILR